MKVGVRIVISVVYPSAYYSITIHVIFSIILFVGQVI